MHICFVTSEYPKIGFANGGVGSFVATISRYLADKGHKVSVVGINYEFKETEENDNGIEIYRLKPSKVKGLKWWANFKSIERKINILHQKTPIDIIETTELGLAFLRKTRGVKYVIRLHGGHHFFAEAEKRDINKWKSFQEKRSFKKADAFIAVSNYVREHTGKYLSYGNKPIAKIPSPINLELFSFIPDAKVNTNTLLFAGTVCEKKGVRYLIQAMPQVIKRFPDVKLNIYGKDWFFPDGSSYINYLENEVLSIINNWKKHITFHGAVSGQILAEKYREAEVCVFPSLMETQGLVAPEAMATKKIVIFSECGPGPETIEHKKTGLLCNPYDINSIANEIIWALEHKNESANIAGRGKDFVEKNYAPNILAQTNLDFYRALIDTI